MTMPVEIRRHSARFTERSQGRLTQHSLSFGSHYDPGRLRIGPMVCHDDHILGAGKGFESHRHSGLEIVTWVVSGALEHTGPQGREVVEAGSVAILSTGSGAEHSEMATQPLTRFIQVWLTAPEASASTAPSYAVTPVTLVPGTALPVAEPRPGAAFSVVRLETGQLATLPTGDLVHVFVATGALGRSSMAEPLTAGDAFIFTDEPAHTVTATVPTDLLVWTFTNQT